MMRTFERRSAAGACTALLLVLVAGVGQFASGSEGSPAQDPVSSPDAALATFSAGGVQIDLVHGICAIPARVEVRGELLEYLLVADHGATHESLFATSVDPELLNAGLLALGAKPGANAAWTKKDPFPTDEELRAGAPAYDVTLPKGDGFYLYVAWREGDEDYLYRAEDLVRDLERQRSMSRHRWTYLGSRMVSRGPEQGEVFAASSEGNLVNISFFAAGHTIVTSSLEAGLSQTAWLGNSWLLPPRPSSVLFVFSNERLTVLPEGLAAQVPTVAVADGR
jgi:hypothetical protein